jgi:TatD DNase family protein
MLFFDAHTHSSSSNKNVFSIHNKYPNSSDFTKPFSIGIHPWFINNDNFEEDLLIVEEKLQQKNCFAIGECGLDTLIIVDFELQKEIFKRHIYLSEEYQKPIIIHCVKAYQEIIEFKKELNPKQVWILHGFNKSKQLAESLIKNNIILSFGKEVIKKVKLQKVLVELPLSSILLETDDADVSIQEMYQKVSEIKQVSLEVLQEEIGRNFKNIFKI